MVTGKSHIISQLQKDILTLQGLHAPKPGKEINFGLGPVNASFPNNCFPLAAIHEFVSDGIESTAATGGFISALLAALMHKGGACIWVSASRKVFPPGLAYYGIQPDRVIFVDLKKEKEVLWAMEEALKCAGLAAVIAEIKEISFTDSRRLQLAVEKSQVTGILLRQQPRNFNTIAAVARWRINAIPSYSVDELPGIGFPRWNVELIKIRNGKPGSWQMEWAAGKFRHFSPIISSLPQEQNRKTG